MATRTLRSAAGRRNVIAKRQEISTNRTANVFSVGPGVGSRCGALDAQQTHPEPGNIAVELKSALRRPFRPESTPGRHIQTGCLSRMRSRNCTLTTLFLWSPPRENRGRHE